MIIGSNSKTQAATIGRLMAHPTNNREAWLQHAAEHLSKSLFKQPVPQCRISVGFPGGGSPRKRIGEHWSPESSEDKLGSIFISPVLDDAKQVLAVLVHEMVHACVGTKAGHGPAFRKCALSVGLEGKMRSTEASKELNERFEALIRDDFGPYPHRKLNLKASPIKKQTTRMIKMTCHDCGYIARASLSSIKMFGPVICPCNKEPMEV